MILFEQNNEIIMDDKGRRWAKCIICGEVNTVDNFLCYGGIGQINKGKCRDCVEKKNKVGMWM